MQKKRQQKTKINNSNSAWSEVLLGMPHGSIMGSILFNIVLGDLFLVVNDINFANYANDNTIYDYVKNIDNIIM